MSTSIVAIVRTVREMMIARIMAIVTLDDPLSLGEVVIGVVCFGTPARGRFSEVGAGGERCATLRLGIGEDLRFTACGEKLQCMLESAICACRRVCGESLARQDSHVDIAWNRRRAVS